MLMQQEPKEQAIFVGNFSYSTTPEQLAELLQVEQYNRLTRSQVRIVKRFGRSRGYGFVSVDPEQVDTVLKLDQNEFNGRTLKVQVAVPKAKKETVEGEAPKKQKAQPKKEEKVQEPKAKEEDEATKPKKVRKRKPKQKKETTEEKVQPKAQSETSEKVQRDKSKLSETVLFVGNLPFSVDDDALRLIFDEDGVKKAQVVYTRNKRSKGFGFAEFKSAEECAKALDKFQKAELDNRTLVIRRAYADVKLD